MLTLITNEVANIEKTHVRGRHTEEGGDTSAGSAVREKGPDGMEVDSVRPPGKEIAEDPRMWRTRANAFPTLSFEAIRNPRRWHRTLGEKRNTDIQSYSDPNRRNIIATTQFSAFQLNDLIARVVAEYTANELIAGLTDAGAAEAALRVAECMETYGHREAVEEVRPGHQGQQGIHERQGRLRQPGAVPPGER